MELSPESKNRNIRIATSIFFFICVPLSIWESNVLSKIFIIQDPVATSNNLLSHEFIFRTTIVSHIIGTFIFTIMMLLFYRLFKPVDKNLARLMIIPIVAQLSIVFILETLNFTALMILKGDARITFDITQQQEATYFLLRLHRYAFGADKIIFGFCFIPMGLLVFRSGFAPRIIGILILIGGIGYVADTCSYILLQRDNYLMVQSFKLYASACYALGFLWFLIKGIPTPNFQNS